MAGHDHVRMTAQPVYIVPGDGITVFKAAKYQQPCIGGGCEDLIKGVQKIRHTLVACNPADKTNNRCDVENSQVSAQPSRPVTQLRSLRKLICICAIWRAFPRDTCLGSGSKSELYIKPSQAFAIADHAVRKSG